MWSFVGSQAVDKVVHPAQALGLCAGATGPLITVHTHPRFQVWAPRPLIGVRTPPGALGLCAQAAGLLIWVGTNVA